MVIVCGCHCWSRCLQTYTPIYWNNLLEMLCAFRVQCRHTTLPCRYWRTTLASKFHRKFTTMWLHCTSGREISRKPRYEPLLRSLILTSRATALWMSRHQKEFSRKRRYYGWHAKHFGIWSCCLTGYSKLWWIVNIHTANNVEYSYLLYLNYQSWNFCTIGSR